MQLELNCWITLCAWVVVSTADSRLLLLHAAAMQHDKQICKLAYCNSHCHSAQLILLH
jgi:hypothetical protein